MTSAPNTVTHKSEVYYRIRDETVNTPDANMIYYINIFGNKLVRAYKSTKAGWIITELHPYNSDGYINIKIQNKCKKLHILAAKTFINPFIWHQLDNPTIDHIDGDRTNNHWTNLRFLERSENVSMHPVGIRNKKAFLAHNPDDIYFESINDHTLGHVYRYNIESETLYIQFVNYKRKSPVITYREVNADTRYKFTDSTTKKRFTIMRQQLHKLMQQMYDEQH